MSDLLELGDRLSREEFERRYAAMSEACKAERLDPAFGGQTCITDDDYLEGAPELIAEISASTVSIDLGGSS
jgi:hypothetical protein